MSDEENTEVIQLAPGLAAALAPPEESTDTRGRRGPDPLAGLRSWVPRTRPVSYTHLTLPTTD